jgi:hypothetical protein
MPNKPYQQTGDYIPRTDAAFLSWGSAFAEHTSADPQRFGLSPQQAVEIAMWAQRYAEAYMPAQGAGHRTPGIVRAKKDTRRSAERIYRRYAQLIKKTPGVTFGDLASLGLHIDDPTNTRIGPPTSAPLLSIRMMGNCAGHILRYADQNTPNAIRKPHGVERIQLYVNVGDNFNVDVNEARELGSYGKQPIRVHWPPADARRTVTYFGRWETRTGLKGPWSLPVYMMIAAGGPVRMEAAHPMHEMQRAAA